MGWAHRATIWRIGFAAVVIAAAWLALSIPVAVPDTHSPTGASSSAEVNDWTSVGHTFRTDRDGLYRIDVPLTTLKATDSMDVQFYIREHARGPNLRTVRLSLTQMAEGKALDYYKSRWRDLPWVSFEFEPLYGHAGKQLYFNIEGKEIQKANTVQALFAYPNGYDRGEAHTAEKPAGANMVFRTFTRGTVLDLVSATFPMLAKGKPGFLGLQSVYQGITVFALILVVMLLTAVLLPKAHEDHQ